VRSYCKTRLFSVTYLDHIFWRLPVFQSPEFVVFEQQFLAAETAPVINLAEAVIQSFPVVAEQLQRQATMTQGVTRVSESLARTQHDVTVGRFDDISSQSRPLSGTKRVETGPSTHDRGRVPTPLTITYDGP
jgi:hypothetical protein